MAQLAPVVDSFIRARSRIDSVPAAKAGLAPFALDARIRQLGDGVLTAREGEVVALILKGHSARSIGHILGIEEGTLTNHKRNIYAKLAIRSQAQLFDRFLRSLPS